LAAWRLLYDRRRESSRAYWGIPRSELEKDDPPVFLDRGDGQWVLENTTTSEFALAWLASSIKWSRFNRGWANGVGDLSALQLLESNLPRLALDSWHWPVRDTRFYGSEDLLVEAHADLDGVWLWISSRTETAFREILRRLAPADISWEASSDEWPNGWVNSAEDLR
jgi:hypothetical protein